MTTTRPARRTDALKDWRKYRREGGKATFHEFWVNHLATPSIPSPGPGRATRRLRRFPRGSGGIGDGRAPGFTEADMERYREEQKAKRRIAREVEGDVVQHL